MTRPDDAAADAYDQFAWLYDRRWAKASAERMLPLVKDLCLKDRPPASRVLDLCCGSGHLAQAIMEMGYQVTAVDGSVEMIELAKKRAPCAEHVLADARDFVRPGAFDGAVCLYDSLNHLDIAGLTQVFAHVSLSLAPGATLLFDLNSPEGFAKRWRGSFAAVSEQDAFIAQSNFDAEAAIAVMKITFFRPEGEAWRRSDVTLRQHMHLTADVEAMLTASGFVDVRVFDAEEDLGLTHETGRAVFVARKPSGATGYLAEILNESTGH
jgi:SAM-dependent methyltransferase